MLKRHNTGFMDGWCVGPGRAAFQYIPQLCFWNPKKHLLLVLVQLSILANIFEDLLRVEYASLQCIGVLILCHT